MQILMDGILLSYRRDDTDSDAQRIYGRLAERLGNEIVFLDIEDIPLGVDFVDAITEALDRAINGVREQSWLILERIVL
jgi:hypothetical protein